MNLRFVNVEYFRYHLKIRLEFEVVQYYQPKRGKHPNVSLLLCDCAGDVEDERLKIHHQEKIDVVNNEAR